MIRSGNPVLNSKTFEIAHPMSGDQVMTLDGTVNKSLLSLALVVGSAYWAWNDVTLMAMTIPGVIVTLVIAIALAFKQSWAPYLAPVYAIAEGFILGTISRATEFAYPGIVMQAVTITFGVFACLLVGYKSGWLRLSDAWRRGIFAATAGIALFYLITFIVSLFGVSMNFMTGNSLLSIGISVVVAAVAAMNLVLDFDFIQRASESRQAPKFMEWYGAFALLVTLVWLYMEILRLLMKLNSRRD
ncbi:MAG: Bax inhibitor-1/YccA family protein [Oligoflexia bacterium]|nr:Bax inhibitor-1/YccA family protein [Oligoflexia bacterium]